MENRTLPSPQYDRSTLVTRCVHLGFGAFHRAHQAVYADILATDHHSDWGYCEVNLIGGEQQIADLNQQARLYTVAEMSADGWTTRVVGVVNQALHAQVDGLEAVLDVMCQPQIAIVSLTITEKGYCHSPATGQLMLEHPLIAADLKQLQQPVSAVGVIVAALARRKAAGLRGFSVMSCDNMPENGHVTRNVVLAYARAIDPALASWIESEVTFPSTMVDRIVPAVTPETLQRIAEQTGVNDPVAVACEPFRQWVIEDNFVAGRPEWEKAGAELVHDVLPFEEMKLRMLNGSHSFLAYLGYLAGYPLINVCMEDANFRATARALMLNEQAPTLKVKGVDLARYADSLIARYENTALAHRTWQIAMDGSQKLPQRMLDSIRWHLANGSGWSLLALGVAGWMRYVHGVDEQGEAIEISDPLKAEIAAKVAQSEQGEARVTALLELSAIFGHDLPQNPAFVKGVTEAYLALLDQGARAAVGKYAAML
ncbi:fructuronate reductase [Atlantibacter subterranea]|uniref:Fructuronate reductase n=1 Tax=Atlantibacter subterraneus TaxID=255519 RepID=A0A427UQD3_9ENTR|nr:fructuronate reductase [Atlantibacter subterranea]MDA3131190.1 fructuronate reductase [Atlantibacter subterranea]RSB59678.1 fructuronate reductase [Atlantibacter subterranea]RSE05639.1 fructuronate reductase [Atlantibacter subterranea]RSE22474.1 fructuronate reductase [Atlantibacter subterranea]